jgi:hypothetical protein
MLKLADGLPLEPHLDVFEELLQQLDAAKALSSEDEAVITLLLSLLPQLARVQGIHVTSC